MSLYENINKQKRTGKSRSKANSTISPKNYENMKKGFPKYGHGGMMYGPSHKDGGIDVEVEGGEFMVQKDAVTPQTRPILEAINSSGDSKKMYKGGGYVSPRKYMGGGYVKPKYMGGGYVKPKYEEGGLIDYEQPFSMKTNTHNYMTVEDLRRMAKDPERNKEYLDKFYSHYSDNELMQLGANPMHAKRLTQNRTGTEEDYYSDLGVMRIGQPTEYGFSNDDTFDLIEGSKRYSPMPRPSKRKDTKFNYYPPVQPETAERLNKLKAFEMKENEKSEDLFNRIADEGISPQRYKKNDFDMNIIGESKNYKEGQ
jgi:hypothetical protein